MHFNLTREFRIACAGAGKSTWIIEEALRLAESGLPSLIVTYTEENQIELKRKLNDKPAVIASKIDVKGWFSFLLDDIIRPYQNCLLEKRIRNVFFNQSNPHKRFNSKTKRTFSIPGTAEGDNIVRHYTTDNATLVHTYYVSKLAERINKASDHSPVTRLSRIYGAIFFDEVQDLVGWDYEVISALSKSDLSAVYAVGDFRQTIYQTTFGTKGPRSDTEKQNKFSQMSFKSIPMTGSHRCCQAICDIANLIYPSNLYEDTVSILDEEKYPLPDHAGVFTVSRKDISKYVESYKPTVLRLDKNKEMELCERLEAFNFGKAKGKEFSDVLIVPTDAQKSFFLGDRKKLDGGKTNKSISQFYVALTRARYSVAILMDEESSITGVNRFQI